MRWKLNGRIGGTGVHLTVEVSRRAALTPGEVKRIAYRPPAEYGMLPFAVEVFDMPLLATGKLDCLCNPHQEEPRDVHDLAILITLGVTPPPEMVRRLGRERIERGLEMLWSKLEKMDWNTAIERLGPYMPPAALERLTPDVWDDMRLKVGTKVETWIRAALDETGTDHAPPAGM